MLYFYSLAVMQAIVRCGGVDENADDAVKPLHGLRTNFYLQASA